MPLGAPLTNQNGKNLTPNFPAYPSAHATFGAAAFHITRHITRLFYGVPVGNRESDNLLEDLAFVSEELNGLSRDNQGTVRPRHVRNFDKVSGNDCEGGLWGMIIENVISRIFLEVHWSFDAFALNSDGDPDLSRNIGGVRLGLDIAEDIWNFGSMKAPKLSPADATIPVSQKILRCLNSRSSRHLIIVVLITATKRNRKAERKRWRQMCSHQEFLPVKVVIKLSFGFERNDSEAEAQFKIDILLSLSTSDDVIPSGWLTYQRNRYIDAKVDNEGISLNFDTGNMTGYLFTC